MNYNTVAFSRLWMEFPSEFHSLEKINARRKNLIDRGILRDVKITSDNNILLVVVLDTIKKDKHLELSTSVDLIKAINYYHTTSPALEFKSCPLLVTGDLSCISNNMLNSVSDVVVAWPDIEAEPDNPHYCFISLLKELNNEPDAFFAREIRFGHNMRNLIVGTLADLWPKLTQYHPA